MFTPTILHVLDVYNAIHVNIPVTVSIFRKIFGVDNGKKDVDAEDLFREQLDLAREQKIIWRRSRMTYLVMLSHLNVMLHHKPERKISTYWMKNEIISYVLSAVLFLFSKHCHCCVMFPVALYVCCCMCFVMCVVVHLLLYMCCMFVVLCLLLYVCCCMCVVSCCCFMYFVVCVLYVCCFMCVAVCVFLYVCCMRVVVCVLLYVWFLYACCCMFVTRHYATLIVRELHIHGSTL